jgi:hypothetical protein
MHEGKESISQSVSRKARAGDEGRKAVGAAHGRKYYNGKSKTSKIKKREEGKVKVRQRVTIKGLLKRRLGLLPKLYNAGFLHLLWVTCDVTEGVFGSMLENGVGKRLKVPL